MSADRFHETRIGPHWLMVDVEFEESVRAIGPARCLEPAHRDAPGGLGRARTRILSLPDRSERLHVRRVLHGGLLAPLWRGRLLGTRRVRRELRVTAALRDRGAPVPRPILATARREGGLWRVAFATLHEENARDALEFLTQCPDGSGRRAAAAAAGRSVRRFHDLGGRHADLHIKNLLIREIPGSYEAIVIDLDRGRVGGAPGARRRRREIARLRHSLHKRAPDLAAIDETERAFAEAYGSAFFHEGKKGR